jgi:DNA-binding transcriptional LysR family regulator
MELHQLQAFVVVAQERSFSRGARLLHIAQPAISRKIKNLEAELNVTLFSRSANGIALTEPGYRFLSDAEHILRLCSRSVEVAQRLNGRGKDSLRIAYSTLFHYRFVMQTLKTFLQSHPDVALNILDMPLTQQLPALELGAIDVGFALTLKSNSESTTVAAEIIAHHELIVALSRGSPLSKRQFITPEDLRPVTIAATAGGLSVVADIENAATALAYVENGHGALMLPKEAMQLPHEGVVFRRPRPPGCAHTSLVWRRNERDRSVMEFVDIARAALVPNAKRKSVTKTDNCSEALS